MMVLRTMVAMVLGITILALVLAASGTAARRLFDGRHLATNTSTTGRDVRLGTGRKYRRGTRAASTTHLRVYAGYYDTHHPGDPQPKPDPWQGAPSVTFLGHPDGASGGWDTAAVRVVNVGRTWIASIRITVDIGKHNFALWRLVALRPARTLIATQTAFENFDASDSNSAGCYGCTNRDRCTTKVSTTIPVVHVTVDGVTRNYRDSRQILNTHGVDRAGCPFDGIRNDESEGWQPLAISSIRRHSAAIRK